MLNIKTFCFNSFAETCILAWDESGEAVIVDPGCYYEGETASLTGEVERRGLKVKMIVLTHAHFDHIFGVSDLVGKYNVPVLMGAAEEAIIRNNKYFCDAFGIDTPDASFSAGEWREFSSCAAAGGGECDQAGEALAGGSGSAGAGEPADGGGEKAAGDGEQTSETGARAVVAGQNLETGVRAVVAGQNLETGVLTVKHGDRIAWGIDRCWEVISTPGHTPGGVCYLDRQAKLLLSGDTLFAGAIGRTDNRWGDYDALMRGIFDHLMTLAGDIIVIPGHGQHTSIADERTKNPFLMPFNEPDEPESDGE